MTELLDSDEAGFEFEVEMIARCIALGLPIAWVPIRTIYAGEPSHIRPWAHFTSFLRVAREARRIVRDRYGDLRWTSEVRRIRHVGDEDVRAAEERVADPVRILVVEQPLPPVPRHVFGQ